MKKIYIICNAGKQFGLGHLSRSLLVATMLNQKFSCEVEFIIKGSKLIYKELKNFKHNFFSKDIDFITKIQTTVNSADCYFFDINENLLPFNFDKIFEFLKQSRAKKIAIDCFKDYLEIFDLIFIPSFKFDQTKNLHKKNGGKIVFGWDCFIIDPNIDVKNWSPGKNIIILTGGSDFYKIGNFLPINLDEKLPSDINLNWITGPFSKKPKLPTYPRTNILEHKAPNNLMSMMQNSNYAVTVYGVTFFELIYLGIPTVVFSPNCEKDSKELDIIRELDIALVADRVNEVAKMLNKLVKNDTLSERLSIRSRSKLFRSGLDKLYNEISSILI